jgi:LPS export ABC transporter protein LptC
MTGLIQGIGIAFACVSSAALAACGGDRGATPTAQTTFSDSAEQIVFGVQHSLTDNGISKAALSSDTVMIFDNQTRFELRGSVKLFMLDSIGIPEATLTSAAATYSTQLRNMEARGNVVVTTTDGKRLDTQHLVYDQGQNKIRSDSAFVIVEPTRRTEGKAFTSDPKLTNLVCTGCVVTQLTPLPAETGRGGGGL